MNKHFFAVVSLVLLSQCAPARSPGHVPNRVLPLRHLRLFESGIGYFERSGDLSSGDLTGLPVPASHLDDALKTLVVLGADSKVTGLSFATTESFALARTRAGLPTDPNQTVTFFDVMKGLRGESVEVTTKTDTYSGRILDVEQASPQSPVPAAANPEEKDKPGFLPRPPAHRLIIFGDNGQIVRVSFDDIMSVKPRDPVILARMNAALEPVGNRAATAQKMMSLLGDTHGHVAFGYVAEVPLWRTSYRIVFGDKKAVLQGWALIHNDTDEDWNGVEIQLANGHPDSFLFPLAAPRYGRRRIVHPEGTASSVPQLLSHTTDNLYNEANEPENKPNPYGDGALGGEGYGAMPSEEKEDASGYATGAPSPAAGPSAHATRGAYKDTDEDVINTETLANYGGSNAEASVNLFLYTLQDRLSLDAHSSALVPFYQADMPMERISYLQNIYMAPHAAVLFHNSTKQTLPAGTIAFFESSGFVGESALPRIAPDQKQYITFGLDLDIQASETTDFKNVETGLRNSGSWIWVQSTQTNAHAYKITNHSLQPRKVAIGLTDANLESKFAPPGVVTFDAQQSPSVTIDAPAGQETKFTLSIENSNKTTAAYNSDGLEPLTKINTIPAAERTILQDVITKLKALEKANEAVTDLRKETGETETELTRLREHLKAIGEKSGTDSHTLVTRILAAEDHLKDLKRKLPDLQKDIKARTEDLKVAREKLPKI